jgi:undecaprenyl-diphosphatase
MTYDDELALIKTFQNLPKNKQKCMAKIMRLISAPFHFKIYIIIILLLYFCGKITNKQIFMLGYSQIIIFTIKYMVKRKRPYRENKENNNIILFENMSFDEYSFPSGHTLNAFVLSYIIKKNININLNIIPYIVGLSRIYLGVHYPTDVIGAIILSKIILILSNHINN